MNILIVEDSPTQSEHLKILLESRGYQFVSAQDGKEAIAQLEHVLPDLIVSDVVMPGMDGYELCRLVKRDSRTQNVPVILLTSLSDSSDVVKGLEAGADNFIFKPFDDEYLLKRIEFALANRSLRDADSSRMGVEVSFGGRKFYITSDRLQILNLLLSTYEAAVERNYELIQVRDELRLLNDSLEARVEERTQALAAEVAERKRLADEVAEALERETAARIEAEDAKSYFRSVFEASPGLYLVLRPDDDYTIVGVSEAYLHASMTARDAIMNKPMFEAFPDNPDEPEADGTRNLRTSLDRVRGTRLADTMAIQRYPLRRPESDGGAFEERFWSSVNSPVLNANGEVDFIIHRAEDVTEFVRLKQQEGGWSEDQRTLTSKVEKMEVDLVLRAREMQDLNEQLRASEERFRLLAKATNDAIWDWDLTTDILWWNEGFETLFGFNRDEVEPSIDFWFKQIHPEDAKMVTAAVRQTAESGKQYWAGEYRFARKDGSFAYVLDRRHIIRDDQGNAIRMVGGMTDLSERKRTEERLKEQAALLDKAQDAILVLDLQRRVLYWNRSAEKLYGWTSREALGNDFQEMVYREPEEFLTATEEILKSGEWMGEMEQFSKDGEKLIVEGRWTLVSDDKGLPTSILAINTDISQRKQLEKQFLRAQRMESIGTLAGGIAHDLNNLLSPVLMGVDLLQQLDPNPKLASIVNNIGRSARRGTDLVKQILSFARGVEGAQVSVNLDHIVHEVECIVEKTFPKNISFERNAAEDLRLVSGDPTQLNQVILNLCVNARDAMPDGGRLTVNTSNVELDEQYVVMNGGGAAGSYVLLELSDEGCGMSKEVVERIFDPFYTTKEIGKGTGLGLSTVSGIVANHGGFINVYSEIGRGSVFKIYLPALTDSAASEAPVANQASFPRGNGECVLVVDDEVSILNIVKQTLEAFGYKVITAEDGAQAIGLFAVHRGAVDLVVTDMMMPVMDGPSLIPALRRIDPHIRIITASGLYENGQGPANDDTEYFLSKPYSADRLLTLVREVLEDPS